MAIRPRRFLLRMDTPPPLADLVMQCVEKDRDLRPQSMADVLAMLEKVGR